VATLDLVVGLVSIAVVAASLHLLLLPLLVLSVVPNAVAALRSARMGYSSSVGLASLHHRRWLLTDLLTQRAPATDIRACGAQPYLVRLYRSMSMGVRQERRRVERARVRREAVARLAGGTITLASYVMLFLLMWSGHLQFAAAGTSALAIRTAQGGLVGLLGQVNVLYEYTLYLADLREFVVDCVRRAGSAGSAPAPESFQEIRVDGVGFSYPNCEQPALTDVSLRIRRGEVIALVGENGSGKTTLAKILAGLYAPDRGTVAWDGRDLAGVDPRRLRDRVALMAQEVTRWPLSARGNIVIGRCDRPDPSGERLRDVAAHSGADRVLAQLPEGLRTPLSRHFRGGRELSSGQWQSLALARALYRDAPLLICDEPAAALDARAEQRSYEAIRVAAGRGPSPNRTGSNGAGLNGAGLNGAGVNRDGRNASGGGRTVVLITHRLASVRMADRIYVLDRGRIVESGTHHQLLAGGGLYAELYRIQAAGYVSAGGSHAGPVATS
jgi:ABC-type multidrug transport system fused ATPase/permease subunit